jgi:riboflavin biosynthesis pyrimidine reductase
MPDPGEVTQLFPKRKQVPLEGLYLQQDLAGLAAKLQRPLVLTAYVTDKNGVVADTNEKDQWQVPPELKNASDWQLFQELMAQADLVFSGSAYLKRVQAMGSAAQEILFQFQPGQKFEQLGQWRLDHGLAKRQPDLAFLSHTLDFEIPAGLANADRKVFVFTTYAMADSKKAGDITEAGVTVVGAGETGVDGAKMMACLEMDPGYHIFMNATGPSVLALLLQAKRMDLIYITEVQREIEYKDPANIATLLPAGKRIDQLEDFTLTHRFVQENARAEDGMTIAQEFRRYDRKDLSRITRI